jgi:hypothetical protein
MKRNGTWVLTGLVISGLLLAGCGQPPEPAAGEEAIHIEEDGEGAKTLTLSERAAQRLGLQTAAVEDRGAQKVVPYGAVIYDADGATWAYVASEPLVFQRASIAIETISGDEALLTDGPATGTPVVTVGAAELYGAETGVGGGH